ncbi:hypothetical protein E2320_010334 [Naja naja]|nr:hypothetical protein E2320_010334 [Naja naja]
MTHKFVKCSIFHLASIPGSLNAIQESLRGTSITQALSNATCLTDSCGTTPEYLLPEDIPDNSKAWKDMATRRSIAARVQQKLMARQPPQSDLDSHSIQLLCRMDLHFQQVPPSEEYYIIQLHIHMMYRMREN